MKDVKVLGPACKTCTTTTTAAALVQSAAEKLGVPVSIETVTDYAAIAGYGVVSTPGIVIDGKVVHAGGLPKADDLTRWLAA
jgi:predicted thioredoxin/glutaredoxin